MRYILEKEDLQMLMGLNEVEKVWYFVWIGILKILYWISASIYIINLVN